MKVGYIILTLLLLCGCSSDETISPEEHPVPSDNIYLEFNQWVYSQMNQQYLWREDMPDSMDCDYDLPPKEFFKSLLSTKDRFSYFTNNPSYHGASSRDLGFAYQEVKDKDDNRALCVLYVTSEAARKAGLHRGDIVEVTSLFSDRVVLKRFDATGGTIQESNDSIEYSIDDIVGNKSSVLLDSVYSIGNRNIGYLCYLEYAGADDLAKPLRQFADKQISELILDLRYNPGGYVSTCQFLCNCIVPQSGYGEVFQECSYNDILSTYYLQKNGSERTRSYFDFPIPPDQEVLGLTIIGLQMERLYVLTSKYTASASEATIVCLRPYMEVITIGEQTVGKGVGSWNISTPRYKYSIQPITMRYYNAKSESTPDEGIVPDYFVPDGYATNKKDIGNVEELLLSTAFALMNVSHDSPTQSCESISASSGNTLTPVGAPSYVTEFKNKHYNESN